MLSFFTYKVKEQSQQPVNQSRYSSPFSPTSRLLIGTHRQNLDASNPNQRNFTATVPQDYLENLRSSNLTKIQLDHIEKNILNQLTELQANTNYLSNQNSNISSNLFQNDSSSVSNFSNKNSPTYNTNYSTNQYSSLSSNLVTFPNLESSSLPRFNHDKNRSNNAFDSDSLGERISNGTSDESTNIEIIERPMTSMTSRKNVSFNNDIDVRIFPKNSKNPKIIESYLLPLTQPKQLQPQNIYQSEPINNDENVPNSSFNLNQTNNTGIFLHQQRF